VDADPVEIRVLGCLIEKQRTTPDVYPLSLNALRAACNQSTNRDPVVAFEEGTIRQALERLARKNWARLASGPGSRAAKYRHLLGEALGLTDPELALLCTLMLRGPQTAGELKQRSERLHRFESLDDVQQTLDAMIAQELADRLPRRPGQKEQRYAQLLGGRATIDGALPDSKDASTQSEPTSEAGTSAVALEIRVGRLEDEVERLRAALESLQANRGVQL
jgi:uncharacterized protein YceH (UPF0502 family)